MNFGIIFEKYLQYLFRSKCQLYVWPRSGNYNTWKVLMENIKLGKY